MSSSTRLETRPSLNCLFILSLEYYWRKCSYIACKLLMSRSGIDFDSSTVLSEVSASDSLHLFILEDPLMVVFMEETWGVGSRLRVDYLGVGPTSHPDHYPQ